MARRLAHTVHVRVFGTTEGGDKYLDRVEMFVRGSELPEWAVPLVGDHVYEPGEAPEASPAPVPEPDEDPEPDEEPDDEDPPTPPAGNASVGAWRDYAIKARGADAKTVLGMSRAQLRSTYGN
jgi:hypothetical protein